MKSTTTRVPPWRPEAAPSLRQEFLDQGYVHVGGVLSPTQVARLIEVFDAFVDGLETPEGVDDPYPYGVIRFEARQALPELDRVICGDVLPALAMAMQGLDEVVLFQDLLVSKVPGAGAINWHQDYSYWPLERPGGAMMWVGLDEALVDNGCLHYVPGSHRWGERQPADFIQGSNQPSLPGLPPLDVDAHLDEVVAVPTRPGDVLIHDSLTWHYSPPNRSDRPRRAFIMTWIPRDIGWDPEHAPHPYNYFIEPTRGAPLEGALFPRFSTR